MARPLRIHVAGGWYHVTARGQRRDVIMDGAGDYRKFLQLVADMRARYRVRGKLRIARESVGRGELKERRTFAEILRMVEGMKREKRAAFWGRYGDWGRDLVLWGARVYGGLTLAELGREAGGMDYSAVSMATMRVVHLAKKDRSLRQAMTALKTKCEKG